MKKILYIIGSLILTAGCTKEADIELPDQEEKLVVSCFISPDEDTTTATVRTSHPNFASSNPFGEVDVVEDATVMLIGNGQEVVLPFDDNLRCYLITASSFPILPGATYLIRVSTPDGKMASASATVPNDTLRLRSAELVSQYDEASGQLNVTYSAEAEDQAGKVNFVALYHRLIINDPNYGPVDGFGNYGMGTFLDDETKERSGYSIQEHFNYSQYGMGGADTVPVKLEINVLNCSKDFYLFNRSVQAAGYGGDSPFGDPVMVYTNIQNGFGCFGAYRKTRRHLNR